MLIIKDNNICILETVYSGSEIEKEILKNSLQSDYDKFEPELKNGKCRLMVVQDTGFIVIKITKKYFHLLGGVRSPQGKNAIEKTTPVILDFCKRYGLIFQVQTDLKKVRDKYLKYEGMKYIIKDDLLYLIYNEGV